MVVGITSIINVPHDVWTNTFNDMRMKSEEVMSAKAEQEAMDRLDAAMAEQRQREQDAREAELAQREADLKQKEEAANAALEQSRKNELLALGWDSYMNAKGESISNLHEYSDMEWASELKEVRIAVEERNLIEKEAQEKAAREALVNERVEKLKAAGWEEFDGGALGRMIRLTDDEPPIAISSLEAWPDKGILSEVERGHAELSRRQQEADKAARKKMEAEFAERQEAERLQAIEDEAKRVAALGDAEKWEEWVTLIRDRAPVMSTDICTGAVRRVMDVVRTESNNLS